MHSIINIIEDESPRARLALLLKHFFQDRELSGAVAGAYPLDEVLLLVALCNDCLPRRFRRHR
jgi:hypothetical protein